MFIQIDTDLKCIEQLVDLDQNHDNKELLYNE